MKRLKSGLILAVMCCSAPFSALAQSDSIELQAIVDFTNLDSGAVPYYLDIAGGRNVLAINAADPTYRNEFARAEHEFTGADGLYDITINALGEIDGDGTYRLLINGVVQGVSVNTPVSTDYTVIEHTFLGIALTAPDVIAVESNAVSNDMVPEGDGFAFARGRWRSVTLSEHDAGSVSTDNSVDLGISLSTVDALTTDGGQAPFIVSVVNNALINTATTPVVIFSLPDGLTFNNSETCTITQTGVRCPLPNLAPGDITTVSFAADINASGWLSLSASIDSDQVDNERANNTAYLSFETKAAENVANSTPTATPITNTDNTTTSSNTGSNTATENTDAGSATGGTNNTTTAGNVGASEPSDSKSGATGTQGLMVLSLIAAVRIARRRRTGQRSLD